MASNIVRIQDHEIFPFDLPLFFIPGIKNVYNPEHISIEDANSFDFMRGEEAQAAGILKNRKEKKNRTIVIFFSHKKFIPIREEGKIFGSITTMS